jgi:error-prone DNA polymerase
MQMAIVAAGFTPGEADQLRRAMAAWKRKGGLEPFPRQAAGGMRSAAMPRNLPRRSTARSRASANTAFPNRTRRASRCWSMSRPGSSATSRRPSCSACSTRSRWAFYSPSQLVQDARRHGVEVRPVDVTASEYGRARWKAMHCPPCASACSRCASFRAVAGERIAAARAVAAPSPILPTWRGVPQLGQWRPRCAGRRRRPGPTGRAPAPGGLGRRRGAAAARPLRRHRAARSRRWLRRAARRRRHRRRLPQPRPHAGPPSAGAAAHAAGGEALSVGGWSCARAATTRWCAAPGIVTCRQRPGTASGVIFVTLEDETGCANVVVFKDVASRQRRLLLGSRLLGVAGQLQREGEGEHAVVHLMFATAPVRPQRVARPTDSA